jgi:hypothetical protein
VIYVCNCPLPIPGGVQSLIGGTVLSPLPTKAWGEGTRPVTEIGSPPINDCTFPGGLSSPRWLPPPVDRTIGVHVTSDSVPHNSTVIR